MKYTIADKSQNLKGRYSFLRLFLLCALLIVSSLQFVSAATITSTATGGSWSLTTTWQGGVMPTNLDDVVIASGATVTINQAVTCVNLTVDGILTTTNNDRVVTVTGNLVVNGSFDVYRCVPLTVQGNTTINGTLSDGLTNGSAEFYGAFTINIGGSFSTALNSPFTFRNGIVNNGTFNKTGTGVVAFSTNSQLISGSQSLTIAGAVTSSVDLVIDAPVTFNGAVTANENVSINNGVTFNSSVTIADTKVITNNSQTIIVGALNGGGANATWRNEANSTLEYRSSTLPMAVGVLDATSNGNTVFYNANADQTIKATAYYHLTTGTNGVESNRSKTLASSVDPIMIAGDLFIGNRSVFGLGLGGKNISVSGDVTLETANTWLRTADVDNVVHSLTIGGVLVANGGEVRLRYGNSTRYCDLTMTGDGDLIQGSGALFHLRNLTLTNPNPKSVSYTGSIGFYSGPSGNAFINNGGAFTATAGSFLFMDAFSIAGSGEVTFNNLQCGNNNQTIQALERNVTVNGILTLNHSNTTSSYLNLNGYTLTVIGGFTRTNTGDFAGNAASNLILGNGNTPVVTLGIFFESGVGVLNSLIHNVVNGASFYSLGSALTVADLIITSGQLNNTSNLTITNTFQNNGTYNQTAGTTFFDKNGGTIDIAGSGSQTFSTLQVSEGTTVTTANNLTVMANFVNANTTTAQAFVASAGTVSFNAAATQALSGAGTGLVSFYDLRFPAQAASRTRNLATNFTVTNLMSIENNNIVYFENTAPRNIEVNNLVVGSGTSGVLSVTSSLVNAHNHVLTINGKLTVNTGGAIYLRSAATTYADVVFTGSGTLLEGNGAYTFHSITMPHADAKSFNTASNINFYAGNYTANRFENNNGAFSMGTGALIFRNDDVVWDLGGTGATSLATLQVGAGGRTNVRMVSDIAVETNLVFNQSTTTNYLDLNGYALTLNGNHTRSWNGRIRGGGTSRMVINGTGNFTTSFAFDQATPGTTNKLAQFDYNRSGDGTMLLGNLIEVDVFNHQQGIINGSSGSIQVNTTSNLLTGSFIDNNNGGTNTFKGTTLISPSFVFNPTSASVLSLSGTVTNNGVFTKDGTGATLFIGNTQLSGSSVYQFLNGALTVSDGVTVVNQSAHTEVGVSVVGAINGAGAGAVWQNDGKLSYYNAAAPMAIGVLDASVVGNTVLYGRVQNTQAVKSATYHHLLLSGGGNRTMSGAVNVNGDLTIGEEIIFLTYEHQIAGTSTGKLVMEENSELRIGRDVATSPVFPAGFVRANMLFDEVSLVNYNGQAQNLSHEPVYSNLAITNAGNKTITGDVVVNGYLNVAAGTLVYGSVVPQTVTVYGDLYGAGGRINMSGGSLAHQLDLYGQINQIYRFSNALNSYVRYLSSAPQQIFSTVSGEYYGKIVVAGGSVKTLELNSEVRGELILNSGIIRLGDYNLTLYSNSTAVAVPISETSAFSATNMIETNGSGRLVRSGTSGTSNVCLTGIYPVGTEGKYSPVNITSLTGTSTNPRTFSVRAIASRHPSVSTTYDALLRYWDMTTSLTTPTVAMNLNFDALDVIGDPAKFKSYLWNGTAFTQVGSIGGVTINLPATGFTPASTQITAYDNETIRQTLYSYKDGAWDDLDTWTTDPSGQNLEGSAIPSSSSNVVILSSRTVHLANNVASGGLIVTINDGGTLDLRDKQFTNPISVLQGQGTLKLATNQMPPASLNTLVNAGGGTVEYNVPGTSFLLNNQAVYNHLTLNLGSSTTIAVLQNNLTLHGSLRVVKGNFQIFSDDATATIYSPITIDVKQDVIVADQGKITTGTASTHDGSLPAVGTSPGALVTRYFDSYHKFFIGGSLYNQGSVKFISSDISAIDFENLTTRGAVSVRFYGLDNAVAQCNGTTDFYNLIIDKGTGQSAELNLSASHPYHFRLFGPNRYVIPSFTTNPEVRKALWIRNGTLRLTGNVTIPSLAEGYSATHNSSYVIPVNGALVVDGPEVVVLTTADSPNEVTAAWGVACSGVTQVSNEPQEFYVNGKLRVNDGYLSTRFSGGIVFPQLSGELEVAGGKISTRQIRTTQNGTTSYVQSGGQVELIGAYTYNTSGVIATLNDVRNVPINYIYNASRLSGTGTFNWISTSNVFRMSGGVMDIYNTSGGSGSCALRVMSDGVNIESTGGQINVRITRNTPYDLQVPNGSMSSLSVYKSSGTGTARLASDVSVAGDVNLFGISELIAGPNSYALNVSGNFNIGASARYNPNQNITRFIGNTDGLFTINGTIASNLYSWVIDKPGATLGLAGTNGNVTVRGELQIASGTLNDNGYTITSNGSLLNSGVHAGTGKILLSGALATRTIGGNGLGVWGNMELNEPSGMISSLTANQTVAGTFTLTAGLMDLETRSLLLQGEMLPANLGDYSESRMFVVSGGDSDGGLIRYVSGNGAWLYPVGCDMGTVRYTPVLATLTDFADDGYLQVNPVATELPLLSQTSTEPALQYYWRIRQSGFDAKPNATYLFKYNAFDVAVEGDDAGYVPGKVVGALRTRLASGVNTTNKTIDYNTVEPLSNGSYTAAYPERFDGPVPVFYSRLCGVNGANWSDVATWSEESHTGAVASRVPGSGDVVYIGSGGGCNLNGEGDYHWVLADTDVSVGEINFSTVLPGVGLPRITVPADRAVYAGTYNGAGRLIMRVSESASAQVLGDMGDFLSQSATNVVYEIQADGNVMVAPLASSLPNLRIEAQGNTSGNRWLTFSDDLTIRGALIIEKGATLALNDGASGNISVLGQTTVGGDDFGCLLFRADGSPRTFTCNNISLLGTGMGASNRLSVETGGSSGLLHQMVIGGSLVQANGTIDLFTNTTGGSNVALTFTGTGNAGFTMSGGTTPDLFRLTVDKGTAQASQLTVGVPLVLGAPTDVATKSLVLKNGTLVIDNASTNQVLSTGGAYFTIPATSGLIVSNGTLSIDAHGNGVDLYGRLRVDNNGVVSIGNGVTTNRVSIQYQGLSPLLEIAGNGRLYVNTQIRRLTNSLAGSLRYRQTGGEVVLHGIDQVYGRAKLEILNTGSEFTMSGGTLTIRRGSGSTFGDLYLMPASSSVTGGEVVFSQGTLNSNQAYTMNSSVSLPGLTIAGNTTNNRTATLTLMTLPLTVNNNFIFSNTLARFNTNNRDVTIRGNFDFKGLWTNGSGNTVNFIGVTQVITGSPTLNHVVVSSSASLTMQPSSVLTVNGNLTVNTPQLVDGANAIVVKKNLTVNGNVVNSDPLIASSGLKLRGAENQKIAGSGSLGSLELDNITGATLLNHVNLARNLTLTRGLLNIGSYLLSLGADASIVSGNAFSSGNMILSDAVYGINGGVRKTVPSGAYSFVFPVGAYGKYTPVTYSATENGASGTVLVRPVNQPHPTVEQTGYVLQYYWVIETSGLNAFKGSLVFGYAQSDVRDDESAYLGARLTGVDWAKIPGIVDATNNLITYPFIEAVDHLNGEYTAGIGDYIPDQVPLFISVASGAWNDKNNWVRDGGGLVPDGGPFGHRVRIENGHTIALTTNSRRVYTTTVNGRLEIGTTYGHNLGSVDGAGTIAIETNQLPAGKFDAFFSCSGGTMEYGGNASYTISDRYATFRNLTIAGSGIKTLPNVNVSICNDLLVDGGTLKISHFSRGASPKNTYVDGNLTISSTGVLETADWEYVYLKGNLSRSGSANFRNNYPNQRFVLNGSTPQQLIGGFYGNNQNFYDLVFDNPQGFDSDENIEVTNFWYNTNGVLRMADGKKLELKLYNGMVSAPGANNYVDGRLSRRMASASANASFAIGNNGRVKPVSLTERSVNDQYWTVAYFNRSTLDDGMDSESMTGSLTMVTASEYFTIQGAASGNAKITLPLTGTNEIAQVTANLSDLRVARWNGSAWELVGTSTVVTGTRASGSVTTQVAVPFNGTEQFFTLATVQPRWNWTGAVDTDWFNGANWSGGSKPVVGSLVTIQNVARKPLIAAGEEALANTLVIQSGSLLTLNPGSRMTVSGNITNFGGDIVLVNTAAQPTSLLTYGTVSNAITTRWTYPTGKYIALGHCVDGNLYANYGGPTKVAISKLVNNGWVSVTSDVGFNANPLMGYYVGFRISQGAEATVQHTGTLRQGAYSYPMGTTWEMIANPYASYIDIESTDFNINGHYNTVYVANMGVGQVVFATYNKGLGTSANGGSRYIAPGQSFYIRSLNAGVPFLLGANARTHGTGAALKSASAVDDVLRLKLSNGAVEDENVLVFRNVGDESFSPYYDSEKRFTTGATEVSLYTKKDERSIIINALPEELDDRAVPLYMNVGANTAGTLILKATNLTSFRQDAEVYLLDKETGQTVNLRENPVYSFSTEAGSGQQRFELQFKSAHQSQSESQNGESTHQIDNQVSDCIISVFGVGNKAVVNVKDVSFSGEVSIEVKDALGRLVASQTSATARTEVSLPDNTLFYVVSVVYKQQKQTFKIFGLMNEK
jgi:hypothetical protein